MSAIDLCWDMGIERSYCCAKSVTPEQVQAFAGGAWAYRENDRFRAEPGIDDAIVSMPQGSLCPDDPERRHHLVTLALLVRGRR
jgi:hypothetical protein